MVQILKITKIALLGRLLILLYVMVLPVKTYAGFVSVNTDSLLQQAQNYISVNIDTAEFYANRVCAISNVHSSAYSKARNIKARVEFSRMHYLHSAEQYLNVIENSRNRLDILEAEVGMMKIYQRTSDNLSFYKYRNSALQRIQSIEEESGTMNDTDYDKYKSIVRDFRTVSSLYFYELEQINYSDKEYFYLVSDEKLIYDASAYLMSLYLKGLGIGVDRTATYSEQLIERVRSLGDCLRYAERKDNQRLQAMSLRATAALLLEADNDELYMLLDAGDILEQLNRYQLGIDLLPIQLLSRAMQIFAANGCFYDMIECHRILASAYIRQGMYDEALKNLSQSLQLFEDSRLANYPQTKDDTLQLQLFREDYLNVEEIWIAETPYATVPESMSSIREQISLAYSGLGDKVASDYNRNVYLELQKTIRSDRRYEARNEMLKRSNRQLLVVLLLLGVIVLMTIYLSKSISRKLKQKNVEYADLLMKIHTLCTKTLNIVSENHSTIDNLNKVIMPQVEELIGINGLSVIPANVVNENTVCTIPLTMPGSDKVVAYIGCQENRLDNEKQMLLNIITPYITSVIINSDEYEWQQEQFNEIVEQHNVYRLHAENNKKENLKRKTYCTVVAESLPYIDRMKAEIMRLAADNNDDERIRYISELVERIIGYNNLLSEWIQMRQGVVKLSVENFELKELFEILEGGTAGFKSKGIQFVVQPTNAVVRADKSLTLFMINTLAENARKFTESGGKVVVSADTYDKYVEISVSDTGIGLSEQDVKTIRETKIYNKGSNGGFGLINCKGIIDKYRKTDQLFDVCSFDVESTLGKGSRFFFRLPKGVKRMLLALLLVLPCNMLFATSADSLLNKAYYYAEQTYLNNMDACYTDALLCADSAISCLNKDYIYNTGDTVNVLSLFVPNSKNETVWFENGFATDYETLLWLRNEIAISALALGNWDMYSYNNDIYLRMFKLYYAEHTIEQDSLRLQRYNGTLSIMLVIVILAFIGLLVFGLLMHVKFFIRYRSDMQQVLTVMEKISEATTVQKLQNFNLTDILQKIVDNMVYDLDQLVPLQTLAVTIKDSKGTAVNVVNGTKNLLLNSLMEIPLKTGRIERLEDNLNYVFPLVINTSLDDKLLGVIGVSVKKKSADWQQLMVLIIQYLSATIYHTILRFELGARNIEEIQEESERIKYEDNQLHVRNLILDNSLSTLKHETVYYPNRIKQLLTNGATLSNRETAIKEMQELVSYYRNIYAILSHNVIAQTGENIVASKNIETASIVEYAQNYCSKDVIFKNDAHLVHADETLLKYLVELLIKRISSEANILSFTAKQEYGFVKFSILSTLKMKQEALDMIFHPLNNKDDMSFVLCRQIIREHDDIFSHIGCRINAEIAPQGTVIWFTLPTVIE